MGETTMKSVQKMPHNSKEQVLKKVERHSKIEGNPPCMDESTRLGLGEKRRLNIQTGEGCG
jgi:hypothetical protein